VDDPWGDPIKSARRIKKRIAARDAADAAYNESCHRYVALWDSCFSPDLDPVQALLNLAGHMAAQSHGFWVDLVEFNLKRLYLARGTDPRISHHAVICAVRVFRSAMLGDRLSVERQLKEMQTEFPVTGYLNAFGVVRRDFVSWQLEQEWPATPHMTTEELATALATAPHKMDGFSRANVFRMLRGEEARLRTEEPYGDGHSRLVRFRHVRATSHLKILHAVTDFFLKQPEFLAKRMRSHSRKKKSH